MNKFITKVFKGAGVNAKVSKDSKNPRFKVVENKLTLEGVVTPTRYKMTITDNTGAEIDELSVSIKNSNDVVNRINESIQTLQMLSKAYDHKKLVEEDEEFDTVTVDDEEEVIEEDPKDIVDGLAEVYEDVLDIAEKVQSLTDLVDDNDAETINNIIGITGSLYDCAIDIDDFKMELEPEEEEDMDESLNRKKTSSGYVKNVISNLAMSESLLRGNKELRDIYNAIKDIKSELIVRGY